VSVPVRMPVLFVGHGTPVNALDDNEFSRGWKQVAREIPRPAAILCVSAHWETTGTLVTGMAAPRTIHDFGGFPRELFEVTYPAPGSPWLADQTMSAVKKVAVGIDREWGLDHGCWSVLRRMYPAADIPVVQLSLDATMPCRFHYELARELAPLRDRGVLILASGNIVHNLALVTLPKSGRFNEPYALDWAQEAAALVKSLIDAGAHDELVDYPSLGPTVRRAVPTPEHYLPLLYALALKEENETVSYFNDETVAGSLTMTSLVVQ
jgi:4,5-DOPA dioxygenase extradiol